MGLDKRLECRSSSLQARPESRSKSSRLGRMEPQDRLSLSSENWHPFIAVLFGCASPFPKAPPKFQVMHDFRRFSSDTGAAENSPKLVYEIRRAYDRREWALELMTEVEESPEAFKATASPYDEVEQIAQRLRNAIGVSVAQQRLWRTDNEAFKQWRMLLERAGGSNPAGNEPRA